MRERDRHLADFISRAQPSRSPAAEMWRRTLSQIPTHFARLVYLAGLRDRPTGRYVHQSLIEAIGRELADRTIANIHYDVFAEWIALPLSRQKADLDQYLATSRGLAVVDVYRDIVPAAAHDVERQLYLTDLETLLALLRFDHGAAFAAPEA
jgi:hypothetical protein